MSIRRKSTALLLAFCMAGSPSHADELVDRLKRFLDELRSDYRPLLTSSHQFMINSYFRDRATDQVLVMARIQSAVAAMQQDVQQAASRLSSATLIAEDIQAGRSPSSLVIPAYRNLFFDRSRTIRQLDDLKVYLNDGRDLVALAATSCSQPVLDKVTELFAPQHFYTNNVLNTVIPNSPDFSWNMTITFRSDGTVESMRGGAGEPGQQLPGGYTQEEHVIAWVGGAAAATAVNAATGAALTAATAAATGVGLAVVAVAYAVMAALKYADKVNAIHEQAELMKEADAIHENTIAYINTNNAIWIKDACLKQKALNADALKALDAFLASSDNMVAQINELTSETQSKLAILEDYIVRELHQSAPAQLVVENVRQSLDHMLQGWTAQEQEARIFWSENLGATILPPESTHRAMPAGVFTGALDEALDNLTIGDCRFAQCYPTFGQKVPVENEDKVSLAWLYLRSRAGAKP